MHRLDRLNGDIPVNPFDFKSLTLEPSDKTDWPVYCSLDSSIELSDPSAQLPWSRALSSNFTAAGMLSVYWLAGQGRRNLTGEGTFPMDRQLTKTWDAFGEYAGDFPEQAGPRHLVHFGTAYKPTPHHQPEVHAGLACLQPRWFASSGPATLFACERAGVSAASW
jgi:hypothetical protein